MMQVEVRRPADLETTSLGAALAAGIGSGFWSQEWVLGGDTQQQQDTVFPPKVLTPLTLSSPSCLLCVCTCGSLPAQQLHSWQATMRECGWCTYAIVRILVTQQVHKMQCINYVTTAGGSGSS